VFGSDIATSLQTAELERRGVPISYEQTEENLARVHQEHPIDWLVYTSALPEDAAELVFARSHGIRVSKRDEFLSALIREKNLKLIAVAGTHGKTTTAALLVWTLKSLGIPVSYSVGATLSFAPSGAYDANAEYFVYEADEYDRNFLEFSPYIAIIPSVDYDHSDVYPTRESYIDAFRQFILQSQAVFLWSRDDHRLFGDTQDHGKRFIQNSYQPVTRQAIDMTGVIMRENAWLVLKMIEALWPFIGPRQTLIAGGGFNQREITNVFVQFPGSSRRFEKLATDLYTDYAHTPTEIAATLERAREVADKRKVVAIYQPHQNLRQTDIVKNGGYGGCFYFADEVLWAPTYLVRGDLLEGAPAVLTPADLIATLLEKSRAVAKPTELDDALWQYIQESLAERSVVVVLGAGPIDGWARQMLDAMKK
jgi:UDP-N-acetylmuramate--alanine ligase